MEKISRRLFMRKSAMVPLGLTAVPVVAEAETTAPRFEPLVLAEDRMITSSPVPTPSERFEAAVTELKRAAKAIDPSISDWNIGFAVNDDSAVRFVAVASREPTRT